MKRDITLYLKDITVKDLPPFKKQIEDLLKQYSK